MATDPDQVRVDLLKLKRKIFLSYPEGSTERETFLVKNKLSEISYLSKLVPEETAVMVFSAYQQRIRRELLAIFTCLCGGGMVTALMYGYHQLFPKILLLSLWHYPLIMGTVFALAHVVHILDSWKKVEPFRRQYESIQKQIAQLRNETRRLK